MSAFIDHSGERIGYLQLLWPAGRIGQGSNAKVAWACQCDDGNVVVKVLTNLRRDPAGASCGCRGRAAQARGKTTHGGTYTAEYVAFKNARVRCCDPTNKQYPGYGARGIEFRFKTFEEFIAAVGWKPDPVLTLDRIDNNGHYEAGNLRWTTPVVQARNRRERVKQ